ncbi:hypothetical protein EF847_21370 [Actinobacteria bacterium YIM 96077]|uniref:SHOCT domain-containing protein n=1 Tax=Phytoactinopolyspora halophila TaxID=1981511 RepID=A0A329QP46_9ACTN|nr:hypothetical protein [Phytoactinopolyspora halophila]AYY14858.1 hypothetical protein EF847_21370 [Actinobacteria bacterium YIM 96077]RAW13132.1 hypothetical protein DPM12_13780 [Phytoactinopolyspora halophila]
MSISDVLVTHVADGPWEHEGGPGFWPIFPLAWFLFITAAVIVTIVMIRRSRIQAPRRAGEARLAEEYAAGQIDAEEYRTRLEVLRGH